MKKTWLHLIHYLSLILILSVGIYFFAYFRGFPVQQFRVIELSALFYFFWGIIQHLVEGDFHPKIMVEYLVIAILGVIIARGAIFR